jgi:regulator-associated protein of mTOR
VVLTHLETLKTLGRPITRTFAQAGSTQHLGNSTLLYPPDAVNSGVHHHHHLHHLHHPGEMHHAPPTPTASGFGLLSGAHASTGNVGGTHGPMLNPTNPLHTLLPPAAELPPSSFSPAMGSMAFHPHLPILAFGGPDSVIELREWPDPN